jgi:hypothetical protein
LDCWDSAILSYRQLVCRDSVAISRREKSVVVVIEIERGEEKC